MIVDKQTALIVDSTNLCYDIIFGSNFLNKCCIMLDYENHQVKWMEYTIPLRDASEFFPYKYYTSLLTPLDLEF